MRTQESIRDTLEVQKIFVRECQVRVVKLLFNDPGEEATNDAQVEILCGLPAVFMVKRNVAHPCHEGVAQHFIGVGDGHLSAVFVEANQSPISLNHLFISLVVPSVGGS